MYDAQLEWYQRYFASTRNMAKSRILFSLDMLQVVIRCPDR